VEISGLLNAFKIITIHGPTQYINAFIPFGCENFLELKAMGIRTDGGNQKPRIIVYI